MTAKRLWIDELKPGMKLAEPVMRKKVVFAGKDVILTEEIIEQLKNDKDNLTILIYSEGAQRKLNSWEESVQEKYEKAIVRVKEVFDSARSKKEVPMVEMSELVNYTLENLLKENFVLQSLKNLQSVDDYTYRHSINVSVLCGILGKWLKYKKEDLFKIVLSGLLHDIGKSQIPLEILNKPGKFTADEAVIMHGHAQRGYELLKNIPELTEDVKLAALQHHERVDGEGYPYGLKGDEIHDFAKIIAVADTYDAVTSNRVYQTARSPFTVVEIFQEEMFMRLDSKICLPMLTQIKNTLVGRHVVTEDGRKAKIVFLGTQASNDMILQTDDGEIITLAMADYKHFQEYLT